MMHKNEQAKMYFIAVVLPAHLDEKVLQYKKRMQELYRCKVGLKSPAHITLVPPFWLAEDKEAALRQDIESIALSVPRFNLTTDNFSAFMPRTIFVAVQPSHQLQELKKTCDAFFRHSVYKIKIDNRPFHPHITIATRDLHKKDFAEAWPYFEKERVEEVVAVNGLSLLKHNGRAWDVVYTAPFSETFPGDVATKL